MPLCPSCEKNVSYLICKHTDVFVFHLLYDYGKEEWSYDRVGESDDLAFYCPICEEEIFGKKEEAEEFLYVSELENRIDEALSTDTD